MKSIERLFKYLEYKGIKHTRAEKDWGLSNGYLNTQLKRNADLGESALRTIIDNCLDLSPEWLLLGRGEMLNETIVDKKNGNILSEAPTDVYLKSIPNSIPISKSEDLGIQIGSFGQTSPNNVIIDIIDVRAAANWSGVAISEDMPETLGQIELPTRMLKAGNHKAFTVVGDSMEPTLYPGDYVVGRLVEKGDYDQIRDHFIYVVVTREGVVIKRLINRLRQRGEIRCRSDNRKYSAYNIHEDDIVTIFEAKAKLSFNFTNEQGNLFDMYHDLEERLSALEHSNKK